MLVSRCLTVCNKFLGQSLISAYQEKISLFLDCHHRACKRKRDSYYSIPKVNYQTSIKSTEPSLCAQNEVFAPLGHAIHNVMFMLKVVQICILIPVQICTNYDIAK